MLGKTGQVGNMLGMLGMLQAKVMARQGTGRATAASVDGQSPCAASERASEAHSTLLDQAPAFVGVKVLEFLHMHESIAFCWQQQQQTRIRDRSLRPALACARTCSGDSSRASVLAVDRRSSSGERRGSSGGIGGGIDRRLKGRARTRGRC